MYITRIAYTNVVFFRKLISLPSPVRSVANSRGNREPGWGMADHITVPTYRGLGFDLANHSSTSFLRLYQWKFFKQYQATQLSGYFTNLLVVTIQAWHDAINFIITRKKKGSRKIWAAGGSTAYSRTAHNILQTIWKSLTWFMVAIVEK